MTDSRLRFWQWWLLVSLGMQALTGYLIAFTLHTGLWEWHQSRVGLALWGSGTYPAEVRAYRMWIAAVLGSTMTAWAVALLWVVAVPFARRERWAWLCIATSVLVWAPVDTGLSLLHGVYVNALFNVLPIMMMAVPLAATWRQFFGRGGRSTFR
ncbi:hypothetical protein [Archangium sp.]|uniref:hypothetical protein n=1 Tax=Archangium sp. TaxID=1872627 RepID=UPI002D3F2384|nr:hypothetical protein [Archangium sp.]HYO55042.1 hypothetical protein [Archangium sp.]